MKFISLTKWRDLTDRHLYSEGDAFPHDGRAISPERISELETGRNRAGLALIRAVEDASDKQAAENAEAPEKPKTARKTARKPKG